MGWEGGVHFALGLDGRRRHDERERRKPAFPGTRQKLENFRVVETRRDVSSVSIETLRVTNQGREGGLSDGGPPNRRYTGHRARVCVTACI